MRLFKDEDKQTGLSSSENEGTLAADGTPSRKERRLLDHLIEDDAPPHDPWDDTFMNTRWKD